MPRNEAGLVAIIGEWIRRLGYLLRRRALRGRTAPGDGGAPCADGGAAGLREHAAPAGRGAGCLGVDVARRLRAGHALCAADAAPQSRVRAHGDRDPCARHRRQHRHVQPRQRPAAAAAVRTPRRSRGGVQPQHDACRRGSRASPIRTTSISGKARPTSSRTWRPFPRSSSVWTPARARGARWRPR